jgi:SHS2 domain-containing protein
VLGDVLGDGLEAETETTSMRRLLAHTADLRAELAAPELSGLYAEAAALVRELLVGDCTVEPREERRFELDAFARGDESERFFRFVRELVYLADAEQFLPARASVSSGEVIVAGERFDAGRHRVERQIKAVTRHQFRCEPCAGGWRAEIVFDL